ncbi:MAG: OmpA family protein, partial [Candidatus Kapaibacterium sp.]
GNFIKGLPEKALSNVSVFHNCETGIVGEPVFYTGAKSDKGTRPTDMVICVEKSAAAVYLPEAHKQLRDFLDTSSFNLMTSLYYFNQEIEQKTGFMRPKEVINLLDKETNNPLISGTSSLYRCAIRAINELEGRTSSEKAVVIMAFSYDNSSIIYDVDRVSQKAKELDIPVYVISVGSAVDSYPLRNLSYMSGGNYYSLSEEEYSKIPLIMDEIAASFEMYYEYEMPYKALKEGLCSNVKSEITLKTDKLEAKDIFRIVSPPSGIHQAYQSLAVFSFRDTVVDNQYMPNLRVLSQVLRDNPDAKVQLTGHSWQEGNSDAAKRLSLRRAQSARKALISLGVDPMQIRVTHEGDSRPVYYLAGQKWMNLYNRRVEIKWLDPEFLPYEIIAQTEPSETVALEKVEKWENLGYRAYFERALNNGIPVYRVVLWGYDTLEKAETALNTIEKNHKLEAYIK